MNTSLFFVFFIVEIAVFGCLMAALEETTAEDTPGRADMGAQDVLVITGIALLAIGVAAAILL